MFSDLLTRIGMDVTALANTLRELFLSPVWRGALVRVTILNGGTSATLQHGLGRAAQAAAVVASTAAGSFVVDPVTSEDTLTVRASSAVGADVTLTLWVF